MRHWQSYQRVGLYCPIGEGSMVSDQRIRELERQWKKTGCIDDHAALLSERVRTGQLPRDRLALAAYCGHAGAARAVGEFDEAEYFPAHAPDPQSLDTESRIHFWIQGLERWGHTAETVAGAAALQLGLTLWPDKADDRPHKMLAAVCAWLANPCEATAASAASVSQALGKQGAVNAAEQLLSAAYDLAGFPSGRDAESIRTCSGGSAAYSAIAGVLAACADQFPRQPKKLKEVFGYIRAHLATWALDSAD